MKLRHFLFLLLILLSQDLFAQEALGSRDRCVAPEIEIKADEAKYPGSKLIKNTSNLRRKTGIAITAAGDRIYFTGKIVDSNCVPVPDALIEIWQADMGGAYTFPIGKNKISISSIASINSGLNFSSAKAPRKQRVIPSKTTV